MSTDTFEDTVRELLHDSADAAGSALRDVDPTAVLARGHRVVRRRRAAVGLGVAAAALAVAGIGAAIAGSVPDTAGISLPAAQDVAPGPGVVTAVLDPFGGLSGPDGEPVELPGPRQLSVSFDPAAPKLTYSEVDGSGQLRTLGGVSVGGLPDLAATWSTSGGNGHVVVGVLPSAATAFQLVTPIPDEGGHPSTTVTAMLGTTGRQAFATRFADASDVTALEHLLWVDADGVVHDERGAVIPSTRLGDPDGTVVFVATALDRMGTFGDGGASLVRISAATATGGHPTLSSARGDVEGTMTGILAVLVADGSQPGSASLDSATTATTPVTVTDIPGSDSDVLWMAYTTTSSAPGPVSAVTWTEPGGRSRTERF